MGTLQFRRTGMKKADRQAYVNRRADELAETGQYRNWLAIEYAIRAEGFSEARQWLDSPFKRKWLDEICARHWKDPPG